MYYKNNAVYIKDKVLFDLKRHETYIINDQVVEIFDKLYNGIDTQEMRKLDYYDQVKKTFFRNNSENHRDQKEGIYNVQIKISNTCNLNCTYCYANHGNYGKKDSIMSVEMASNIAKQIKNLFPMVEKVSFFGGEPLLNINGIETIIRELDNKKILYSTVTNGTILNDRLLKLLKNHNIHMCVSLDGPKELNDLNRVNRQNKGTFDLIAKNIDKIQSETNAIDMIAAVYTKPAYLKYTKTEIYEMLYKRFKVRAIGVADVFTEIEHLKLPVDNNIIEAKENADYVLTKIIKKEFFVIN